MKKYLFAITLSIALFLPSCDTLKQAADDYLNEPTLAEVGMGLKQALEFGISEGATVLSKRDGYYKSIYKILLIHLQILIDGPIINTNVLVERHN